jgi:hypothetical protein
MTRKEAKHPKGLLDRLLFWRRDPPSAVMFSRGSKRPVPIPVWTFPEGLEVQTDTSPAQWIEESLPQFPWATVGAIIPKGFEQYARILHPAYEHGPDMSRSPISWAEIAQRNGRVMHPLAQFGRIAGLGSDPYPDPPSGMDPPYEGDIPPELIEPLVQNLQKFTKTPDVCWFLLWTGFGDLPRLKGFYTYPQVEIPGREYLLLRGSLSSLELLGAKGGNGPNLWWPDDHAWCVATEIDLDSFLVGW